MQQVNARTTGPEEEELHAQVRTVEGSVNGIAVRFIDTPGLQPAASAAAANARILADIRRAHNKHKPDIVLYFDRMDLARPPPFLAFGW